MESSKMVLMNLFSGQEERCRQREQTCGHSRGRSVKRIERVALKQTHYDM